MPQRVLALLAALTLADPLPLWAISLQGGLAALAAWWLGLTPMLHTLGMVMTLDWFYGALVAIHRHQFSWSKGVQGLNKKAIVFSACLALDAIAKRHGIDGGLVSFLVLFYVLNEAASIVNTFRRAGIPVADAVGERLNSLRKQMDSRKDL